jgi:Rod binding domain-containing protein
MMAANGIAMKNGALAGSGENTPSPRLVRAAHEFEGQMMKELLKPMTGGDGLTGAEDDEDSSGGSTGALGEFASETLGQALSARGGFGIAHRIEGELSRYGNGNINGKVTGDLHRNTVMRSFE